MLYGTTPVFLERLGLDSLRDLPPLGDFVPDASVVDALERGLRLSDDPTGGEDAIASRVTSEPTPTTRVDSRSGCRRSSPAPGLGSRRACEELIVAGRVTVDGAVAVLGDRVDPTTQRLALDGVTVVTRTDLVYYLLNKPARVVTTAHDPEGRRTVVDLVPAQPRVFPVGRLDYDTEGLSILTNDGELAQLLSHPSHGVEKAYVAEVDAVPTRRALRDLREGVDLDDGRTAPARARVLAQDADGVRARDRHPRGAEPAGPPDVRGGRPRGAPARAYPRRPGRDAHLAPGEWRALRPREVRALYTAASANNAGTATAPH